MRTCSLYVCDDALPKITFDSQELCNYYKDFDKFVEKYLMGNSE